jgi:hypothetical protein
MRVHAALSRNGLTMASPPMLLGIETLGDFDLLEAAIAGKFKDKRLRCAARSLDDAIAGFHEIDDFIPKRIIRAGQVEAPRAVLFDCRYLSLDRVKLSVMAKYSPPLSGHRSDPNVVWGVLGKPELSPRVVVILDGKRTGLGAPDQLRKALSKTSIEIECQCASD